MAATRDGRKGAGNTAGLWAAPLLGALCAASVACSACAEDRGPLGHGADPAPVAVTTAAVKHHKCSGRGVRTPDGGTFLAVTEIPSLGGAEVKLQDINNDGVAVGTASTAAGNKHAIRYTDVGGLQDLGALAGFGGISFGSAIASDGAIAGHSDDGDGAGTLFGFRYTAAGGHTRICPTICSAWDLNARGQVVGLVFDGATATEWQAFLYTPGTGLQRLGTLGGKRSSAAGITDAGVVVGNAQLSDSPDGDAGHAFIWDAAAGMRDLNTLARDPRWILQGAADINGDRIVGWGLHDGQPRAFAYDISSRSVRDLGGAPSGAGKIFGWSTNVHGDVVGWADNGEHRSDAFVYTGDFGLRRLNDFLDPAAGWDLQQANAINDRGDVVGWGFHDGAWRGFKLTMPLCTRPR